MIRNPIVVESVLEPALQAVVPKEPAEHKTAWITVSVLIGAGVIAATQIGKGIISLPTLQGEFGLAYGRLSLVVSMFALLGATVGSLAGIAVQRFTPRRCLIAGLFILGAANLLGSLVTLPSVLIALRIIEGVGFFGVIISVPSMLNGVTAERDRSLVMSVWGAYLPFGVMCMALGNSVLLSGGWRNLWFYSGVALISYGFLVISFSRAIAPPKRISHAFGSFVSVLKSEIMRRLTALFFLYSFLFFSLSAFLALFLADRLGADTTFAISLTGMVIGANAIGNVSAGLILRAGGQIRLNLMATFVAFAIAELVIFSGTLSPVSTAWIGIVVLGLGGLAPASIYTAAPSNAPTPEAIPIAIGLVQQASNLGQFAGPTALGWFVDQFGWTAAPVMTVPVAVFGLVTAALVRNGSCSTKEER
jgi:predicted MFS family arabinose efflux permease